MGRGVIGRNSFVAGVLSPRLEGRSDLKQYGQGARQLVNGITRAHGGVFRRRGTIYTGSTKYPSKYARLIPFEFNTEQSYLIEAGDFYFRFWTINGLVLNGLTPLEVVTPYAESDLALLQKTQDADVAIFVHPNFLPHKLSRVALSSFTLAPVAFNNGRAPVRPFNQDVDNTVTLTGTYPNLTATFVKDTLTAGVDVGRALYVRDVKNKRAVFARVTTVTSTKVAQVTGLYRTPTSAVPAATDRWALGVFSDTEGCNAVAFHEGRLWYGGFKTEPDYIVASVSGEFDNFELENPENNTGDAVNDDKAITRRVVSGGQVSTVLWMRSASETLVVGTAGAEFLARSAQSILTPTDTTIKAATTRGSAQTYPTGVDGQIFFIQQGGFKLRQFVYALESDNYVSKDVAILAEHLTRRGLEEVVYQQDPDSVLWVRRRGGGLAGWTVDNSEDVVGGHEHELGGIYGDGPPQVLSIAVLQGASAVPPPVLVSGITDPVAVGTAMGMETVTGWTQVAGTWAAAATVTGLTSPYEGANFIHNSTPAVATTTLRQTATLTGLTGWSDALVTAGRTTIDLFAAMAWATAPTNSSAKVIVEALTSADVVIGEVTRVTRPNTESTLGEWRTYESLRVKLPATTAKLRITCQVVATSGNAAQAGFDGLQVVVRQQPYVDSRGREQVEDSLWMIVRRTVNGASVTYVERMAPSFAPELGPSSSDFDRRNAVEDGVFTDCSLTLSDDFPITGISAAHPAVFTTPAAHGLTVHTQVMLRGVKFRREDRSLDTESLNNVPLVVAAVPSSTSFTLVDSVGAPVSAPAGATFVASQAAVYREFATVSGLAHLANEPVHVLANGRAVTEATVSATGTLALPFPASLITIGLPYTFLVETTRFFGAGGREGTDEGARVKLSKAKLRFVDSLGGSAGIGPTTRNLEALNFGTGEDALDRPFRLYSGDLPVVMRSSWDDHPTVIFVHAEPYPAELLATYVTMESNLD